MELAKLLVLVEAKSGKFAPSFNVLFNPNQVSIQKSVNWRAVPRTQSDSSGAQFTHGDPATLSMDLFFDTYGQLPVTDVRTFTRQVFSLTTVERHGDLHRPPLCKLQWGTFNFENSQWVLQSLNQRFTVFHMDGTPLRAMLSCTFRQWRSGKTEAALLDKKSADVAKTHTVERGETLSGIAAEEYRDPSQWRAIADANRITNPRLLVPGHTLIIPPLRPTNRVGELGREVSSARE